MTGVFPPFNQSMPRTNPPESWERPPDPESSVQLLERVRKGDEDALDRLFARYLLPLRRWAHGRLPPWARTMSDTQDIVQDAIVRVLRHLATFEPERPGALHAYLRKTVSHRILDELRHVNRRPAGVALDSDVVSPLPSPYELASRQEDRDLLDAALEELRDEDRELVIGRVEWGFSYEELAVALDKPSVDAVRVAARRAVVRLADIMARMRNGGPPRRQAPTDDAGRPS
jgi:RNA polymerase sigma-70 factor (ECF subfamily)